MNCLTGDSGRKNLGILDSAISSFLFGVCLLAESINDRRLSSCDKEPILKRVEGVSYSTICDFVDGLA